MEEEISFWRAQKDFRHYVSFENFFLTVYTIHFCIKVKCCEIKSFFIKNILEIQKYIKVWKYFPYMNPNDR